jgi:hypothetical protein
MASREDRSHCPDLSTVNPHRIPGKEDPEIHVLPTTTEILGKKRVGGEIEKTQGPAQHDTQHQESEVKIDAIQPRRPQDFKAPTSEEITSEVEAKHPTYGTQIL